MGITKQIKLELTVALEEYPDVPEKVFPVTVEYREEIETKESGFEVFPFPDGITVDPFIIEGN